MMKSRSNEDGTSRSDEDEAKTMLTEKNRIKLSTKELPGETIYSKTGETARSVLPARVRYNGKNRLLYSKR